jgi:hypothetical protein
LIHEASTWSHEVKGVELMKRIALALAVIALPV